VATSVELAGANKTSRPFKGLVNAVLRGLLRDAPPSNDPTLLAPPWLYSRWVAAFGEATARDIAGQIALEPATDLSLKPGADAAALAETLEGEILPGGSLRLRRKGDVAAWPGFEDGSWWVQDAAAAVPARLLDVQAGETVLDLCAAPGGKTNNSYIFPGVGLGVVASEARHVTDRMFAAAARTLASLVLPQDLELGRIYPSLTRIREVSAAIGTAVAQIAFEDKLAQVPRPADVAALVKGEVWEPVYRTYV